MNLAPLAAIVGPVLPAFPLAQHLRVRAIDQEIQAGRARPVRNDHREILLSPAQGLFQLFHLDSRPFLPLAQQPQPLSLAMKQNWMEASKKESERPRLPHPISGICA
jgi:hypothetical protein